MKKMSIFTSRVTRILILNFLAFFIVVVHMLDLIFFLTFLCDIHLSMLKMCIKFGIFGIFVHNIEISALSIFLKK